jgi:hypothetical protein
MGFFVEGSFTDNIVGANYPASYFVYETYQGVGVNLYLYEIKFKEAE